MATQRARRIAGEGSLYQRESDGRWVGVIDLGWVGGKRKRKTVYGRTKTEASNRMKEARKDIEQGVIPSDAKVSQWMKHWLDEIAAKRVRSKTLYVYRGYVRRWITPEIGAVRLDKLTAAHVRGMLRSMEDADLSPASRKQALAILQRALKVAVHEQRVVRNVAELVDRPKVTRRPHGALTRDETMAMLDLLAAYGDDGEWAITSRFLAALLAGLRQGEALGLRWEDVALAEGRMHVRRSVQRLPGRGLVEQPVKSKDSVRVVPLMPPLALALTRHAEAGTVGYVWGGERPTDPRADWGTWKGLLWSARVADRPLHSARSTTANILHEARVPDRVIAAILGHADFEVTWSHYLSAEDRQVEAAMRDGWEQLSASPE